MSTIATLREEPGYPSADEGAEKMRCKHTTDDYSAARKNETLPFATTWMEPESVRRSEISQRKTITLGVHAHVEYEKQNRGS